MMFPLLGFFRRYEKFVFGALEGAFYKTGSTKSPLIRKLNSLRNHLYFSWYEKFRPRGIVLRNVQENQMYINSDDRGMAPMLLMGEKFEPYQTELFRRVVKEGMVVVDIGANIGYYTLIAARRVGKNGVVYAFEPEPTAFQLLRKNVELNDFANVVSIDKAISNKADETLTFWTDSAGIAISSFAKDNVTAFSGSPIRGLANAPVSLKVETSTLDVFFADRSDKIDVIKIDAQGAEGLIIEGAKAALDRNDVKIFMEFWPEGLRKLQSDPLELMLTLQALGFRINVINEKGQTLKPIEPHEFCMAADMETGHHEFNLFLSKSFGEI